MTVTVLWHRWFVQYNPFYLASALFILGGIYLVTRNPADWDSEQLVLAGVIQLYELALIAAAGFLFTLPHQRRPATILGIAAIVFLFDVSFRAEGMASIGSHTLPAAIGWVLLLGIKLPMLGRALRVHLPVAHCAAWLIGGGVIALAPPFLSNHPAVLVGACWIGIALVCLGFFTSPKIESAVALDGWGHTVLRRIAAFAPRFWAALYWVHVITWCGIYDLKLTPACFAPLVALLPLLMRHEALAWVASGAALVAAWPSAFGEVAALLAVGLAVQAWRAGYWTLYVASAAFAYLAAWKLTGLALLPTSPWAWGATLVAAAFAALAGGVMVNWWAARRVQLIADG